MSATNPKTETARALLYRHGVPEDVVDGVLCLHGQELAAVQRAHADQVERHSGDDQLSASAVTGMRAVADFIDPTRPEDAAVVPVPVLAVLPPTADRAAILREAIARVEDPEERGKSPIGMGLGWESAHEVLRRMLHETPASGPGRVADETRAPCGRSSAMPTPCSAGGHCCTGPSEAQQPETQARRRCPSCGHFTCDGNGPCGAILSLSAVSDEKRCTCVGPAVVSQPGKEN